MVNKDYLKDILADRKALMKMDEVKFINVPKYDELSVKTVFPMIQKDAKLMMYFPAKMPKGRLPDRDYTFNILNTLRGDYVSNIITHAQKLRNAPVDTDKTFQFIQVSETWQKQLEAIPFISSKCSS